MEISIKIQNLDKLKAAFNKAPVFATAQFDRAIERTAFKIQGDAMKAAPVNKGTGGGNLRQSIKARMTGKARALVESQAKYSAYVDQGTRPHIIRAKNARVLANRRTGRFFGKIVHHPGTRAQPYFSQSLKNNESFMNSELKTALQNILNSLV